MKFEYIGIHDIPADRDIWFKEYSQATILDCLLNERIKFIRDNMERFEGGVTAATYATELQKILAEICKPLKEDKIWEIILTYYEGDATQQTLPLVEVLFAHPSEIPKNVITWRDTFCGKDFIYKNKDNYRTCQHHNVVIPAILASLEIKAATFMANNTTFVSETDLNIGNGITIKVKSSTRKYILMLLRVFKEVRQARWLAWLEEETYKIIEEIPFDPQTRYIIALPEFYFVDYNDSPGDMLGVSGYVKPFYESIANYYAIIPFNTEGINRWLEDSFEQRRLKDLTFINRNVMFFAGTMIWKTGIKTVYTNGVLVFNEKLDSSTNRERPGYRAVETDMFYNTAAIYARGGCIILDKQFISKIDGVGGIKVIHKHEVPGEENLSLTYIKSNIGMNGKNPIEWTVGGNRVTILLSICLDFHCLAHIEYPPENMPDIQMVIAYDLAICIENIKAKSVLLVCDKDSHVTCFNTQTRVDYEFAFKNEKYTIFNFDLPLTDQPDYAIPTDSTDSGDSFYQNFLKDGLSYTDKIEVAALPMSKESVNIYQNISSRLETKPTGSATGIFRLDDGMKKVEIPIRANEHTDENTKETLIKVQLAEGSTQEFDLPDLLLFTGNQSHKFLKQLQIPKMKPAKFELDFYKSGHRVYDIEFKPTIKITLVDEILVLEKPKLSICRSGDNYKYTLSAELAISNYSLEFGVVSGVHEELQLYLKPALPKKEFPSVGKLLGWLLSGETGDFSAMEEFKLLDLAITSITGTYKPGENKSLSELEIGTRITLASLAFDVNIYAIGKRISGHLSAGESKSVADIVSAFCMGASPTLPDALRTLKIVTANFDADIKQKTYSATFSIQGKWDCGLSLDNLSLNMSSTNSVKTVGFCGAFTLFETLQVDVGVLNAAGEWSVNGGVAIPEGETLSDLFKSFNWNCPDAFERISLSFLSVSCAPKKEEMAFRCAASLTLDPDITMKLLLTAEKKENDAKYHGEMTIGNLSKDARFQIDFDYGKNKSLLNMSLDSKSGLSATDFCKAIGYEDFTLPDCIDLTLKSISGHYDFKEDEFAITATTKDDHKLYIRTYMKEEKRQYTLAVLLNMDFSLKSLPVVGNSVPLLKDVSLHQLKAIVLSTNVELLTVEDMKIKDLTLSKGVYLMSSLKLLDKEFPLNLPLYTDEESKLDSNEEKSKGVSIDINKNIGPLSIQKIGASFSDGTIWFMLDTAFQQSALSFSLDGMGVGYKIKDKEPSFRLQGMSVDVKTDAVTIGGSFLKVDDSTYQGSLLLKLSSFSLTAAGSYTAAKAGPTPTPASFFVFALLQAQLGGPPAFFITGIAVGFGYNRKLNVPNIDKLETFSLLKAATGGTSSKAIFEGEKTFFPPSAGGNWIAAGITFNSFKMIDSVAILTVGFGNSTEINLLGKSVLDVPYKADPPIGHAVLLIKVSFKPSCGLVSVDAVLSSESYILSKSCHISGGFAFYVWYSGEHAGDFVLSLGGYNNIYKKPSHYPAVPRLGLNWTITDSLTAQGSIYFALTPSCIMAGGTLKLLFTTKCIGAWFDAYIDILIQWKPYAYDFNIGITIGVRVDLKLFNFQLELGCSLHIWGPEFSGIANIKLWCISFSIPFGETSKPREISIKTDEFVKSFLPGSEKTSKLDDITSTYGGCTVTAVSGLISEHGEDDKKYWVLCAEKFELVTKSSVPSLSIEFTGKKKGTVYNYEARRPTLSVKPCNGQALDSRQEVTLVRKDTVKISQDFTITPIEENLPSALWAPKTYSKETIPACTGISIKPMPIEYYKFSFEKDFDAMKKNILLSNAPVIEKKKYKGSDAYNYISKIDQEPKSKRAEILKGLGDSFKSTQLTDLAANAESIFCEKPRITTIGGRV